jgi:hypothetical protein
VATVFPALQKPHQRRTRRQCISFWIEVRKWQAAKENFHTRLSTNTQHHLRIAPFAAIEWNVVGKAVECSIRYHYKRKSDGNCLAVGRTVKRLSEDVLHIGITVSGRCPTCYFVAFYLFHLQLPIFICLLALSRTGHLFLWMDIQSCF